MKQLVIFFSLALAVASCGAKDADKAAVATKPDPAPAESKTQVNKTRKDKAASDSLSVDTPAALLAQLSDTAAAKKAEVEMTRDEVAKAAEDKKADAEAALAERSSAKDPARVAQGDAAFKPGRDYIVLTPAQRTSSPPEKVEVTEVFMYQCRHCFSFEPFIKDFTQEQPAEVNFVRLPAVFNPTAKLHAKVYYAALSMGIWDQLHTPLFREIHTNRNLMPTEAKVLDFIESQGVEREAFRQAMKSFEVDAKVRDAEDLNRRYRIDSVPTLVVNGKYIASTSLTKSTVKLREVLDYLVSKESGEL